MVKISLSKKQNNKNRQNNAKQNKSCNLRKRSKSKSNSQQKGGDGQMGHTVMPTQYFGKNLDRYFPEGDSRLESPDSAFGKTHAVSFGTTVPELEAKNMTGPDLAPHHRDLEHSSIQTGGKRNKGKQGNRRQKKSNRKVSNKKTSRRNRLKHRGGDGQMGHTVMPTQYFGKNLDRYFPEGDSRLESPDSAFGKTHAVSFGTTVPELEAKNMTGPDLAPHHRDLEHSSIQTGGKRKGNRKNNKKNNKNKKN